MEKYTYEILAIDPTGDSGITTESNFIKAISFSEKLWENSEEKPDKGTIQDSTKDISLQVQKVDISQNLTDYISDSAFMINISSTNFENLAKFRYDFLIHIKSLKFANLWILTDDISCSISRELYPLLNSVESSLRRYLIKFFIQKVGLDWLDVTVPKVVMDKIKTRSRKEHFYALTESRLTCVDFDALGEVIYQQTSGFNSPDKIIEKINRVESFDEFTNLKNELQTNYTKYFKTAFQENQFEKKWKQFFEIRNKVAHNHWFTIQDLEDAKTLSTEILEIIKNAENKIQEFSFSIEDKEAFRNAAIEVALQKEENDADDDNEQIHPTPKIIGTIDFENISPHRKIVSEDVILELLAEQEKYRGNVGKNVGLKHFVTVVLADKGFSIGPSYSLINILNDKGMIEIFDDADSNGFTIKVLKRKSK